MGSDTEIHLLVLTDLGAPDVPQQYINLPPPISPPYTLRFLIDGTSSICRQGSLWINVPEAGQVFERSKYREFKLQPDFHRSIEIDVSIHTAGSFSYYVRYAPITDDGFRVPSKSSAITQTPTYYLDVAPSLQIQGRNLPLDALATFSVISKFLGPFPKVWSQHFSSIADRKYNMVHFTPLMQRGESNSPYSLYDQLRFDPAIFPRGEDDVRDMIKEMEQVHGLLGMTDVVWNHTANNCHWLQEHPEAGYNVQTAPWLESALELDTALLKFGRELKAWGLPLEIRSMTDLLAIMDGIKTHVIGALRLWEYYLLDVDTSAKRIVESWVSNKTSFPLQYDSSKGSFDRAREWSVQQQADYLLRYAVPNRQRMGSRFERRIEPELGAGLLTMLMGRYDERRSSTAAAQSLLVKILDEANITFSREYDADVTEMLEQVFNRIKYIRLDDHGPKAGPITESSPIVEPYFTHLPTNETTSKHDPRSLALVNNGWVWAADAMRDHAGPDTRAYLRREVIVWGDCVKLRYGQTREDNPWVWDHMAAYTRLMAKYFAGFRIDNCHSTPIAVAEYLLDQARQVRPNLAVFAELFTGSQEMDYVFMKRLALTALIREAMQAWDSGELARLVHNHGGRPIGSFDTDISRDACVDAKAEHTRRIRESPLQALFMDCTHDNEVPAQKRQARDTLPNAALVSMCACASGSVMGYDEIYPKLVNLVTETRPYASAPKPDSAGSGDEVGIGPIKKILTALHVEMGQDGFDETHVHHEGAIITVHREQPIHRKGYFAIAHTAFPNSDNGNGSLVPVKLKGTKARLLGCWSLQVQDDPETKKRVSEDQRVLHGLPSHVRTLDAVKVSEQDGDSTIAIEGYFPPGSVALLETSIPTAQHSDGLDHMVTSDAAQAVESLNLIDLNFLLYRCDAEERDSTHGSDGVYTVPGCGPLVYAGLQGWWSILKNVIHTNDLSHPLCEHLRNGQWALDFISNRLEKLSRLEQHNALRMPAKWIRSRFDAVRKLPSFLLPRYFALAIQAITNAAFRRAVVLMTANISNGNAFLQRLALVSVQQTGLTSSASLWPTRSVPCLAAGLPHFATDWARCWGRDVFISLRGLHLATGRFGDAKDHILAFASVMKHGLIPNLLGSGKGPRYNARDAVWFFLQAIQDYTKMAPDGILILQETVDRRFLPFDDTYFDFDDARAYSVKSSLQDIIQEALQRHASGISFREANAGPGLDRQMRDEGFQIDVHVDWDTGFVFGGNQSNCGTWMDKMGESERAANKGVPGTPRDGAAVEITGLLFSTVHWLASLHDQGSYPYEGVKTAEQESVSWSEWSKRISKNFERCYFVPTSRSQDKDFDVDVKTINRRGIYKDLYRSGKPFEDYQLRCNFPIAMAVAPSLFTADRALQALQIADRNLRGPTGMATLDPSDQNYRPYYNNSEDSNDFATSKGRNYHQGPEWVWPLGYLLRAMLNFTLLRCQTREQKVEAFQQITQRMRGCQQAIVHSPWAGLTELTNKQGAFCADSSPTQAWSASCLMDVFQDAAAVEMENGVEIAIRGPKP